MEQHTWQRVWGPEETCECGDVEFEIGSRYESSDGMVVSLVYFVTESMKDGFGVEYRCEVWAQGQEDDAVVTYDWASALAYSTLEDAIAKARRLASEDESYVFV